MLTALTISNVALIEHITIALGPGLTIVTGETGAGKSILVDALGLALGERADTTLVRQGAERAVVEAEFDAAHAGHVRAAVEAAGAGWQSALILRREVTVKGVSRCFVNDSPVPVAGLRDIGAQLVDIHGQHDHQSLLHPETHRGILDGFGGAAALCDAYADAWHAFTGTLARLRTARDTRDRIEERRGLLEQHLRDIAAVDPTPGEDEDIERELRVLEHAERLAAGAHELLDTLYDRDESATDLLGHGVKVLSDLAIVDPALAPFGEELRSAAASVGETARALRDYVERIDVTPGRAEMLRHRLAAVTALTRRFRCTLSDLIERRAALAAELGALDGIDETVAALERDVEARRADCASLAAKLHAERARIGTSLGRSVSAELATLGIRSAVFETHLTQREATVVDERWLDDGGRRLAADEHGWDDVEFHLSANTGEAPRALARVVSGGEVSRIMLALKSIFAGRARVPVMVFDEIDTGVSGAIARKVGAAMKKLAANTQIIAITHLPQIAGAGDAHLVVEKRVHDGRTTASARALDGDDRAHEVARLLAGDTVTEAAVRSARELLSS
jgi:DNA repair protein RecN (Recombination protein N)